MTTRWYTFAALAGAVLIGAATPAIHSTLHAQSSARPLHADNFGQGAPRGFGDRNNSWAQSMVWWHDALYVGTGRQALCTSLYSVWQFAVLVAGRTFADLFLPYPPANPDLSCPTAGWDLSIQAEIWRWDPEIDAWARVFQSPLELDNPGAGVFVPPAGSKVPYEIAIRGLTPHVEPDGTDALYAFGVNSTIMWDRSRLPSPRILRSVDGLHFEPIPQTPGTFLGDLPFNPDHSSFRSPVSFGGKLFVLAGPVFGQGSLIGSADPAKGDDAWFLASPPDLMFYELATFNGWLYLGTISPNGYSVLKTRAEGPPPYELITVVPPGAYLPVRPSRSVVSMQEYLGRLFVGTATQTEIIRINPDDTWDLVVGPPRQVPLPGGGSEWKYPTSGLDAGFGHTLNDHAWQMDDLNRFQYVGTYNASVAFKDDPVYGPLLQHNMGAHLYRSKDSWYYSAVTTNGFANPDDPLGGRFDYGIRSMAGTPHGAFFGTTNDYYGLAIVRGRTHGSPRPDPPDRLEIEPAGSGGALLSWAKSRADQYEIWRAQIHDVLIRDDANFEGWSGTGGNKIPDTYIGPYERIGVTKALSFIDTTVETGKRYMYYVKGVHQDRVSDESNLVTFPLLTPPVTFARLEQEIDRLEQRQRLDLERLPALRGTIADAQERAANCRIGDASETLQKLNVSQAVMAPEATDVKVLVSKLERRLGLFGQSSTDVMSDEFCTMEPLSAPSTDRQKR